MNTEALVKRRASLIDYMKMKIESEDWHAVADAAMDLRELDVEIRMATLAFASAAIIARG